MPKRIYSETWFQNRAISRDICREYGPGVEGRTGPRDQSPLCVPLDRAQPTFLYQTFAWSSLGQLPSHPFWNPKPLPPTSSFVFNWRWYLRWGFHTFGELLILPGSLPCICLIKLLCDFLIFISFMSVEFLGQPEEPRRVEENLFLSNTFVVKQHNRTQRRHSPMFTGDSPANPYFCPS